MFENLDFNILPTILTAIASSAVTLAGSFMYYRQERERREIENETSQSEEWKKLYIESKADSEHKDAKIDELRREINELRTQMIELQRKVQLSSIYTCTDVRCTMRKQPSNE